MNYLIVILLVGFLILVHETGHFIFARLVKIKIARFSIGFGPKVWQWGKGETEFRISIFPIGGYVIPAVKNENDFFQIPVYKRIIFSLGGSAANVLLPCLIFIILSIVNSDFSFSGLLIEPLTKTFNYLNKMLFAIPNLFTEYENLSGIIGIVAQGGQFIDSNIQKLLHLAVMLSLNLAILNMLPFPVLDGGKILLYLLEKVHPKLLKLHLPLALVGWIFIFGLMIYVTINDVTRLLS